MRGTERAAAFGGNNLRAALQPKLVYQLWRLPFCPENFLCVSRTHDWRANTNMHCPTPALPAMPMRPMCCGQRVLVLRWLPINIIMDGLFLRSAPIQFCRMHTAAHSCGVAAASAASSTVHRWARLLKRSPAAAAILKPRSSDPTACRTVQQAARRPTTAAALPSAAASKPAMAPVERQFGEWESPITSDLITSAVREGNQRTQKTQANACSLPEVRAMQARFLPSGRPRAALPPA